MGGRDRRSLRQHRRDPTTRLTPPSAHDITTRRTAARQRQPAQRRTRAPSSTHPTQRCRRRHRHERPGLDRLFAGDEHVQVECTWGIYQRMIFAYRDPDRAAGRAEMDSVIDALIADVPGPLVELRKLGRTLTRRAGDVLAYFDRPRTSNGPTEAVNGRLEHLRGLALGFRNLTHYIARALLEAGGFRPQLHPAL